VVVGAWSHPLSLSGGSASFFEVLMVGGVLGGGCERGDAGERLVRWMPVMVVIGLLSVFGCWFGQFGGDRRCSVEAVELGKRLCSYCCAARRRQSWWLGLDGVVPPLFPSASYIGRVLPLRVGYRSLC
jgi:hypothetical protein